MRMIDADFACKGCIRYRTSLPCEECVVNDAPTVDAVPVIRCEKCVLHGNCVTEDAFVLAGIDNPFCCAGKNERRTSMKIWTDDEYIEVDPNDVGELEAAMRFKAEHIKAKADPELFAAVAYMLFQLWDYATKRVDVVICRECKLHTSSAFYHDRLFCQEHGRYVDPDGYCYLGERKEGADNG